MGTGKPGRVLNTFGSSKSLSQYALVHAIEGTFNKPSKKTDTLRLVSGGHGQDNIDLLNKYNIKYEITKTYNNGVRVGNVENHKQKSKRENSGQAWFPASWTSGKIKRASEYVASLKKSKNTPDGTAVFGTYQGVRVGIIRTNGKIATVFPDTNQSRKNRR